MNVGRVEKMTDSGPRVVYGTTPTNGNAAAKSAQAPAIAVITLPDMPEGPLDGWLGELVQKHMSRLPRAYSWPAALTAAALKARAEGFMLNLYTALVGGVGTAKTEACKHAIHLIGLDGSESLLDLLSGSGEALIDEVKSAGFQPRLFFSDELGHLLSKMLIENSSYPYILNRAFYETGFKVRMGRGHQGNFNAVLSILGGVVSEKFEELFGRATTAGFYDRVLFGQCPTGFLYDFRPMDFAPPNIEPSTVRIDGSVWEVKSDWLREDRTLNPRLAEIVIRCAAICASLDRRERLEGKHLGPARELLRYESKVRQFLQPNPGRTLDAEVTHKILSHLRRAKPGEWVNRRDLFNGINAYRIGPVITGNTLKALVFAGDIEVRKEGKQTLLRLVPDENCCHTHS